MAITRHLFTGIPNAACPDLKCFEAATNGSPGRLVTGEAEFTHDYLLACGEKRSLTVQACELVAFAVLINLISPNTASADDHDDLSTGLQTFIFVHRKPSRYDCGLDRIDRYSHSKTHRLSSAQIAVAYNFATAAADSTRSIT
jgi:hypothetical protein